MWHAEAWSYPDTLGNWEIAGQGFVTRDEFLTDEARRMEYGPLFVYMFRRFGPSEWGSDDYKEIACWYLTTPNPDVILTVSPAVPGARYAFGYGVNDRRYTNRRDPTQKQEVIAALRATLADLLVPVSVRDSYINAIGRVNEEELLSAGEDGEIDEKKVAKPFKWAGYGIERAYFEKSEEEDNQEGE